MSGIVDTDLDVLGDPLAETGEGFHGGWMAREGVRDGNV